MKLNTTGLSLQKLNSTYLALGVQAQPDYSVQERVNSLYNHGAVEAPEALSLGADSFGYVVIAECKLREYFASLSRLAFEPDREETGALCAYLAKQADCIVCSLPVETFLHYGQADMACA